MAITGTGTELDPFIVHSYDEIKEKFSSADSETYLKLGNDIDCNDYGSQWEWTTIQAPASSKKYLDLDGHTIKNAYISVSNLLFAGYNTSYGSNIYNGKILNIFGTSIEGVFKEIGLDNISLSFQVAAPSSAPLRLHYITNCAIYGVVLANGTKNFIDLKSAANNVINDDIYAEISGITGAMTLIVNGNYNFAAQSIRLTGKMSTNGIISARNNWWCTRRVLNSVVEIDMSNFSIADGTQSIAPMPTGDNTTVVNVATINTDFLTLSGYLLAPDNQTMRTGAALRSLNFLVVNVEE